MMATPTAATPLSSRRFCTFVVAGTMFAVDAAAAEALLKA